MAAPARKKTFERGKTHRRSSPQSTVRIPKPLIDQARPFLVKGSVGSINKFVADSVAQRIRALREVEIDKAFAAMSQDAVYQAESMKISKEFEASDWHSLQQSERQQ